MMIRFYCPKTSDTSPTVFFCMRRTSCEIMEGWGLYLKAWTVEPLKALPRTEFLE